MQKMKYLSFLAQRKREVSSVFPEAFEKSHNIVHVPTAHKQNIQLTETESEG